MAFGSFHGQQFHAGGAKLIGTELFLSLGDTKSYEPA
jgi:hypothetical protein